jgi:hypothetical protein
LNRSNYSRHGSTIDNLRIEFLPVSVCLLIEALELPQNRRQGDDFSAIDYFQDIDPELKEPEIQNMLHSIEQKNAVRLIKM